MFSQAGSSSGVSHSQTRQDESELSTAIALLVLDDVGNFQNSRKGKDLMTDEEMAFHIAAQEARASVMFDQDRALAMRLNEEERQRLGLANNPPRVGVQNVPGITFHAAPRAQNATLQNTEYRGPPTNQSQNQSWRNWLSSWFTGLHPEQSDEPRPSSSSIQCTSCMEPIKGVQISAPCGHSYDKECIADLFQASTRDSTLFPPRCCRQQIPVHLVKQHLSANFLSQFEAKIAEHRTMNRVYCANQTCSQFLGPQVQTSWWYGPKTYTCSASGCQTITCGSCKQKIDSGGAGAVATANGLHVCKKSQVDQPVVALGKREGWAQCPGCGQMIELHMGCFHMTCLCKTEFCYLCRAIWKTCRCTQWDERRLYAAAEERVDQQLAAALRHPNPPRATVERRRETQVRTLASVTRDASQRNPVPRPTTTYQVPALARPTKNETLRSTQQPAANSQWPQPVNVGTHLSRSVPEKPRPSTSTSSRTSSWVQTQRNPSSPVDALFSSADVARRRRDDTGNDTRRAALIHAAADELLRNHDCRHDVYGWSRSSGGVCQMCQHYLPIYLFICKRCRIHICNRCRRNRI